MADTSGLKRHSFRRPPMAWVFFSAGIAAIPLYLHLGSGFGATLLYDSLVLGSAVAVTAGTIIHKPVHKAPWILFSIAMSTFFIGALMAGIEDSGIDATAGDANTSDLFSMIGYILLVSAMAALMRARTNRRDQTGLIDALIIVTAAATLMWALVIQPVATNEAIDLRSRLVAGFYPAMNLTLLTMLLRLAFSSGTKVTAQWLLMTAVLGSFSASQLHLMTMIAESYYPGHPLEAGWLVAYICAGSAALHPTMRQLTDRAPSRDAELSKPRIFMFGAALLVGPAALLIQKARGETLHPSAVIIGTTILSFLILVRVWGLLTHLRRNERRFRSMVQNSSDGTAIINRAGTIVYVTEAVERILGHKPGDLVGRSALELTSEEDLEKTRKALAEALRDSDAEVLTELRMRSAAGKMLWLECHFMNRLNDRAVEGIVTNFRDITERKLKEEQLRQAEESYRQLFDNALEGIYESTPGGQFLKANRALAQILGYSDQQDLLGVQDLQVHWAVPGARDRFLEELAARGEVEDYEIEAVRRGGEHSWVSITATAVKDASGEMTHIQGMVKDITARKEAEKANQLLWQAQKMEAVGQLAGGIAHDFNNLLSVIINYTSFALDEIDEGSTLYGDISEVNAAGERGARLVRQLLKFSRKGDETPEALDVLGVAENLQGLLVRTIGEDTELCITGERGLLAWADQGKLEQILMNLVVNARDAMSHGGKIVVTCKRSSWDPEGQSDPSDACIALTVSDTGLGMSKDTAALIFDPFFTTKKEGAGTGLGLSTVSGIVEQMGGRITVETELGQGTCFTIRLPIYQGLEQRAELVSDAPLSGQGTGSILVCEDEIAVRDMVRRILERGGYSVLCADSPLDALNILDDLEAPPRLLLTDVVMPFMSGVDLAEEVKRRRPGMRIAFMSGYADEALGDDGVVALGKNFLAKPFSEGQLLELVTDLLPDFEKSA